MVDRLSLDMGLRGSSETRPKLGAAPVYASCRARSTPQITRVTSLRGIGELRRM
jgi:hypothetical protein